MKEKLAEKYLLEYYRNYLLKRYMFIQDYIATFEDLTCRCDVRPLFPDDNKICFRLKVQN